MVRHSLELGSQWLERPNYLRGINEYHDWYGILDAGMKLEHKYARKKNQFNCNSGNQS